MPTNLDSKPLKDDQTSVQASMVFRMEWEKEHIMHFASFRRFLFFELGKGRYAVIADWRMRTMLNCFMCYEPAADKL